MEGQEEEEEEDLFKEDVRPERTIPKMSSAEAVGSAKRFLGEAKAETEKQRVKKGAECDWDEAEEYNMQLEIARVKHAQLATADQIDNGRNASETRSHIRS